MKNKKNLGHNQETPKETKQINEVWYAKCDPRAGKSLDKD